MVNGRPSQKTKTPSVNGLGTSTKVPYAAELDETSDLIADNTLSSLRTGKMTGVEAAGQFSLALLLKAISTGQMKLEAAYPLLKTLADKKTPNPAQQVEQHQVIDLQAMIGVAVQKNPNALTDTVALAIASRQQIREKLDLPDSSLTLEPAKPNTILPSDDADSDTVLSQSDSGDTNDDIDQVVPLKTPPESLSITLRDMDWKPGDAPPEIQKLDKRGR